MMSFSTNRYYKGISLFIKACILVLSIAYIIYKINSSHLFQHFFNTQFQWLFFIIAVPLVFINWGLEAYKWKYLIQKLEKLSFLKSFQSVLSGVTIGIFTPNRVGEFAGRVFYLDFENKPDGYRVQAALISFIGSAFQLLVTIVLGIGAAIYIAAINNKIKNNLLDILSNVYFIVGATLVGAVILLFIIFQKNIRLKYKNYVEILFSYTKKELTTVFLLSLIRYIVFTIQYYMILKCFNIDLDFNLAFSLIALTFLLSTIVPTFAFTEITVRGASAMYLFGLYISDASVVLASSLIVWLINLALPSIIGIFYIWRLKFFKEKD